MDFILLSVLLLIAFGLAALAAGRAPRLSAWLGAAGPVSAAAFGLPAAIRALTGRADGPVVLPWDIKLGALSIEMDHLSAFFIIPILALSAVAAIYGVEYMKPFRNRKSHSASWLLFNLLVASMVAVCLARNALLFLLAWEVMAISSFFLVTFENEKKEVREAGWTYLAAAHLGAALLLPMFLIMGGGSLEFADFGRGLEPAAAAVCFILALAGFGSKAGVIPFHVWLPDAHPAAPSHVSALLSGVMIKTGIYGLVRTLTWLQVSGPPPAWWGWTLIGVGAVSGILGVLFAIAQHDLKRLLAYHSVENIGIIVMGIGIGMLGISMGHPGIAALGFAGGLLHVVNHAAFKGLLFLGAGSAIHGAHTREMDRLGGLLKRMPWTGALFMVGAAAICGLPPLNGFVSEFLIYLGAFRGVQDAGLLPPEGVGPLVAVIAALALIGGLAAACFTKAFGIVFLGEPRSEQAAGAHESGWSMKIAMAALAGACVAIGLLGPQAVMACGPVIEGLVPGAETAAPLTEAAGTLQFVTLGAVGLIGAVLALALLRRALLAGRRVEQAVTWDCGYAAPTARMQYTASSFAQPITLLFRYFLRTKRHAHAPEGYFPQKASCETHTPDVCREAFYAPVFRGLERLLAALRVLQQGRVQVYVLYVVLTLLALLIWKLW
jgi:hydrogenase-4 component B